MILFEKLGDGAREGRGFRLEPRDGLLNPGFLQLDVAPEQGKELFVFLNTAYGPDRHGDFYTSTACAACDKYKVCLRPK